MRRAVVISLLALGALVTVLLVGRSSALQTERTLRAEILEANSAIVAQEARIQRLRADSVTVAAKVATRGVRAAGANVDAARATLEATLDSSKAVLADMAATADDLRASLGATVVRAESLVMEVTFYRARVDTLLTLVDAEREAREEAEDAVWNAVEAEKKVSAAWKEAAECRVLWIKCPTRLQVAVGAAVTTYFIIKD